MELCREIGAPLHRHRDRALARLLFRRRARARRRAPTTRCARRAGGARRNPGRADGRLLLRRQSRHGLLVREAGAARPRARPRASTRRRADGPARAGRRSCSDVGVKGIHIAERDTQRAKQPEAARRLRQHLVGRGLRLRGPAAGRARLGHVRALDAGERPHARDRLPGGDLPAAAGRQHARALLDADRAGRNTASSSRTTRRSRSPTTSRCGTARARPSTGRPATTPTTRPTTRCCRCTRCSARPASASPSWHILDENEIVDGIDELGVLLYGHGSNAYWYGSQLSIEETRRIAPYQNATGLQVTSAVLAGMVWALENPQAGIVEADEMDFRRCLEVQMPYLGPVIGALHGLDAARPAGRACSRRTSTRPSPGRSATRWCGRLTAGAGARLRPEVIR